MPVRLYRHWCQAREDEAVARQKQGPRFWSNASTERQFGASGPRGDLSGAGSSRYKQRAFYDFARDLRLGGGHAGGAGERVGGVAVVEGRGAMALVRARMGGRART